MAAKSWYIISTGDVLQLPLYYAEHCEEVAEWLGCTPYAVFTAFARAKKRGEKIIKVMGYTLERQVLDE